MNRVMKETMSSLPGGTFHARARDSTRMPIGCFRAPAARPTLPSQNRDHTSCCDTLARPISEAAYRLVSLAYAAVGQLARSSVRSELNVDVRASPVVWSPRGSKKNAPTVSPGQLNVAVLPPGMIAAIWRPALKMYWSGLPLGQKPPPSTGLLVGSTHDSPML